uniref:G-protein coupled receptors family 1 profile domain-containing protein n=1 Tax=Plectus sambesii TaxID=2011161 RepID=A0A914VGX1_9BILA
MVTVRREPPINDNDTAWLYPTEDAQTTIGLMPPAIFFMVMHMSVVMTLAIVGNLFLIVVILRGNQTARRKTSPVQ